MQGLQEASLHAVLAGTSSNQIRITGPQTNLEVHYLTYNLQALCGEIPTDSCELYFLRHLVKQKPKTDDLAKTRLCQRRIGWLGRCWDQVLTGCLGFRALGLGFSDLAAVGTLGFKFNVGGPY